MNKKLIGTICLIIGLVIILSKFFFLNTFEHKNILTWIGFVLTLIGAALVPSEKSKNHKS